MKPFTERFLYHIWDGFHFINPLLTQSGKNVEIIFQGRWNTYAGPDFLNAVIKINGEIKKGDIEIHLDSYDWKRHHHNENVNYNNVILHIVYTHNLNEKYTISENGQQIEIVKIGNFLDKNIKKLLTEYDNNFEPKDKFCGFFAGETVDNLKILLSNLGIKRLENKVKRFNAELLFNSFDQVIYSAIMEAMGYSKNKFQMIKLAENLTYRKLLRFYQKGMDFNSFVAIILVESGLINILPSTFPRQFIDMWLEEFYKQDFEKKLIDIEWETFRIRPVNNPAIRFLQIAELIYKSFEKGITDYILSIFSFSEENFLMKDFKRRVYDFFEIGSKILPKKYHIGKSRIDTILINIIIPIAILYSRKMQYDRLESMAKSIYSEYSGNINNFILDFMSNYMNSNQRKIINKKAIYQQGALNIYYSFCNKHLCEFCIENKKDMMKEL